MSDNLPNALAALLAVPPLDVDEWEQVNGNPLVVALVVRQFLASMAQAIQDLDDVI